ncbi:TlpA family protein disulfide reductase [Chitinophaga caseinilytica]|uniref:TlpA family protein disulfide reductase n=1 Tax=Chitinophaga caseinilytica TaxID=2267521 RepID=UPI003C2F9608
MNLRMPTILLSAFLLQKANAQDSSDHERKAELISQTLSKDSELPRRLTIGDIIPTTLFNFNETKNYGNRVMKWEDFKPKKLIILDFWNKYCSSCIAGFPKMEQLQKKFNSDIQVILITTNTIEELKKLFKNSPNVRNTWLPMAMSDSLFKNIIFPSTSVPHHVWIDGNGKVIAITYANETNEKSIQQYLKTGKADVIFRNEFVGQTKPKGYEQSNASILTSADGIFLNRLIYYSRINKTVAPNSLPIVPQPYTSPSTLTLTNEEHSLFTTSLPEYYALNYQLKIEDKNNSTGLKILNASLPALIRLAYNELVEKQDSLIIMSSKYFILDKSAEKTLYENNDSIDGKRLLINNSYCYESKLHGKDVYKQLQKDIQDFFNLTGSLETKSLHTATLYIKDKSKLDKFRSNDQPDDGENYTSSILYENNKTIFNNTTFNTLIGSFNVDNRNSELPVFVDSTGLPIETPINFVLNSRSFKLDDTNLELVQESLSTYGLQLRIETKQLKVLVVKRKQQ